MAGRIVHRYRITTATGAQRCIGPAGVDRPGIRTRPSVGLDCFDRLTGKDQAEAMNPGYRGGVVGGVVLDPSDNVIGDAALLDHQTVIAGLKGGLIGLEGACGRQ